MHLLKLGLRPWKLAFYSQALSSLVVAVLLLMIALFVWFDRGLGPLISRMRTEQVITAYLLPYDGPMDESAPVASAAAATTLILEKAQVAVGIAGVIRLIGPTEFLEELRRKEYATLASELEEMGSELTSIVPRYLSIEGSFDEQALERVREIPGVESAESSRNRFAAVVGAFASIRWVNRALILGLFLALATGLVHLGRINTQIHEEPLRLLRQWGANGLLMSIPPLVSGASVGVLGGALAAGLWLSIGMQFARQLKGLSPIFVNLPNPHASTALVLAIIGLAIGVVSTLFHSTARSPVRT